MLLFDSLNLRAGSMWAQSGTSLPSVLSLFLGEGAMGCASCSMARRRQCCWCGMFQAVWRPSRTMAHLHLGRSLFPKQSCLPYLRHACYGTWTPLSPPHPWREETGRGHSSVAYSCRKNHICASGWLVISPPLHLPLLWQWVACPESWSIPRRSW